MKNINLYAHSNTDVTTKQCCCQDLFLGLEIKIETLDFRSRDRDLDKMNSSALESQVSRSQHWLHQFQLVKEHSIKGNTNYGNRATGV